MKALDRFKAGRTVSRLRSNTPLSEEEFAAVRAQFKDMGPGAIEPVMGCLSHGVARKPAICILDDLLTEETFPLFLSALGSPNPAVVSGTVKVLSENRKYHPTRLLDALDEANVQRNALETVLMARAEEISAREILDTLQKAKKDARPTLLRLREKAATETIVPDLVRMLHHEDWWIRLYVVKLLGRFALPESEKGLQRAIADKNKEVRLRAVEGLQAIHAVGSVEVLVGSLRDPDLKVQSAAIDAVSNLGDASTVPLLLEILKDDSEYTRRAAVEVLNAVATTEAIQDLVRALQDEDWWVRVRAADALGTLGGEKVVEAVVGLLREDDDFVRRYAVEILNTVPSERAVGPLIKALDDPDWWVRERSIDALGATGDTRAVQPLIDLMVRDDQVAPLCARALGVLGDARAEDPLERIAQGTNTEAAREAKEALKVLRKTIGGGGKQRGEPSPRARVRAADGGVESVHLRLGSVPERGAEGQTSRHSEPGAGAESGNGAAPPPAPAGPIVNGGNAVNFHNLPAHSVLLNRFRVLHRVGKGGFGSVYLAEDAAINEEVILKVLNPQLSADETSVRRFVQELKLTRRISHANVIRIHDFMDLGGAHAVSMEYFPGKDLGKLLGAEKTIEPLRALRIAAQICDGLEAAHQAGVIHRDVKPGNVLVGENDTVKIVDFGLASPGQQAGSRLTKSGLLIGTPEYMAPEQINGSEVDARADIYSLGIILYEALSGQQPYTAETPVKILFQHLEGNAVALSELVEGIPEPVTELVASAMAREAGDRPATAREMRDRIDVVLTLLEPPAQV